MTVTGGVGLLASYLVGSFPTGYVAVKWLKRVDVRSVGSGNIGATNVARAAGVGVGALVLAVDVLKGLAAVWGIAPLAMPSPSPAARLACGVAAVLGHNFPVALGFRGGKGVATTLGVVFGVMPLAGLVCLGVWLLCVVRWRYVSAGSLAAAAALPAAEAMMRRPVPEVALSALLGALIIVRHRANIVRLLKKEEPRVSLGRRGEGRNG